MSNETQQSPAELLGMPTAIEMLIDQIDIQISVYKSYQKDSHLDTDMFLKEIRELQKVKRWAVQLNKTYGGNK
jgi:hypothetical protein